MIQTKDSVTPEQLLDGIENAEAIILTKVQEAESHFSRKETGAYVQCWELINRLKLHADAMERELNQMLKGAY